MAVKDIFKISRKTFFNPSAWLGTRELGAYTRIISNILKTTFTKEEARYTETFEEALERLNVTDADLQRNARNYRLYALFFAAFSITSFLTGFYYLFRYGTFAGWVLATIVGLLFAVHAFRFDFWHFQIKHRKLGCTFDEWRHRKLNADKGPSA